MADVIHVNFPNHNPKLISSAREEDHQVRESLVSASEGAFSAAKKLNEIVEAMLIAGRLNDDHNLSLATEIAQTAALLRKIGINQSEIAIVFGEIKNLSPTKINLTNLPTIH